MTVAAGADAGLLGFTHAVRAAGVAVTPDRGRAFLEAVAYVGLDDRRATYAAGRATLCASPDDLERYDAVFAAWFRPEGLPEEPRRGATPAETVEQAAFGAEDDASEGSESDDQLAARASAVELLRERDVATLSADERARLAGLFAGLRVRLPVRRTPRRQAWHRGRVDPARTLRASLRRLGEPAPIAWHRPRARPRRVVLLIDVSGSMSGYADALLRLAHRLVQASADQGRGHVEVFTVGTRLTHLTRALAHRDPDRALVEAGRAVPDWSGGTRLGETLGVFLDRWGRRGMARGAVVVVASDGWERGGAELLGAQMERLGRVAHRVVWVNPHRGKAGYEPVQAGIVAALPHIDTLVAGHSLAAYAEVIRALTRGEGGRSHA